MAAVLLALASAALFGSMAVAMRTALARRPDVQLASLGTVAGALVVALAASAAEAPSRGLHLRDAWPFALAGVLQPGLGQLLATLAIREAGASRTSVTFGLAPLVSVVIALVLLGEPAQAPLLAGAVLVVAGGVALASEQGRPEHLRAIGMVYAFLVTLLFSIRDNLVRWLSHGTSTPPAVATAASLVTGLAILAVVSGPRLQGRPRPREAAPFVGVGLMLGLSYVALFEAYYRGRVTVVSPLIATESLWGVALSLLLLRRHEHVGGRLLAGALLVVAGGALIGAFR
jgi:drug/metabolite transporter (DMT)-like permease